MVGEGNSCVFIDEFGLTQTTYYNLNLIYAILSESIYSTQLLKLNAAVILGNQT